MPSEANPNPRSRDLVMQTQQRSPSRDTDGATVSEAPLFSRQAGSLALAAGALLVVAQVVWWPFDQRKNLATSRNAVFQAGSVVYLVGFCVLMFALIAAYGLEAHKAGRLGAIGVSVAIVGTMLLAGDLWFESFAVPWLAEGPEPQVVTSEPSTLLALGAVSSYLLFAVGWVLFGVASLRARVFPAAISLSIVVGGVAGFFALLAPGGMPLGVAVAALGVWVRRTMRPAREIDDPEVATL